MRAVSGRASRLRLHHLIYRNGTVSRGSVSSRLVPPSEGGLFSRISASPSEGAQSPEALCSVCTRDFAPNCLLPPSEGELFSRISASPSEGVQSPEALCSVCTPDFAPNCLLPPSEGGLFPRISASPSEGAQSPEALCSVYTRDFAPNCLVPPSKGALLSRISASPSEGALSKRHCCKHPFSVNLSLNLLIFRDFVTIWRENATFRQASTFQSPLVHNLRYPLSNARKGGRNGDPGEGHRKDSREGPEERGDRIQKRIRSLL